MRTGFTVASGAKTGAVTLIRRFGSALNLNIHFHLLFLGGAYSFDGSRPMFHRAPLPIPTELARLLHRIAQRAARLLEWQGLLVRDPDRDHLDFEPGELFDLLVGASIHYRIAIGPNAGRQALALRTVPAQQEPAASTLLAKQPGFSLHAATCCEANQRGKLEELCRCIARPAIANERLGPSPKTEPHALPWGVRPELQASQVRRAKTQTRCGETRNTPRSHVLVAALEAGLRHRSERGPIETCPKCGGKLRVLACIEDPDVIATILVHIQRREAAEPSQPRAPPRRSEHLDPPNQDRLF